MYFNENYLLIEKWPMNNIQPDGCIKRKELDILLDIKIDRF